MTREFRGFLSVEQFYQRTFKYGRILGLDIGRKRIGVAVSDQSQQFARPLGVLQTPHPKQMSSMTRVYSSHT